MMSFTLWLIMICWRLVLSAQLPISPNPLNGQHLRIIWPPWEGNPKGLNGPLKGGVIIDFLSARFNFTYEMVRVTENHHEATAKGKGLLSFLTENKVDFLVDVVAPTNERLKIIDLTQPWSFDVITALIPAPDIGANTNAVIKPFHWQVWLSIGISIAVVVFVTNRVYLPLASYVVPETLKTADSQPVNSSADREEKKLPGQFLYFFGNLVSQGGPCQFSRLSFRVLAGCWTLAAFVLVQAYNSTLLTYVMVPVSSPLISAVSEIPDNSDIKVLVRKNGGVEYLLSRANESTELFQKLRERIQLFPDSRCNLIPNCITLITPGSRNVYLDGRPYLMDAIKDRYVKTGKCDMQLAKEGFYNYMAQFAMQKNSRYTPSIDRGILELQQSGLINHWESWFRPMPNKCDGRIKLSNTEQNLSRLSLKNLTGAFLVLAVGFTISILVFLAELLMNCLLVSNRCRRK